MIGRDWWKGKYRATWLVFIVDGILIRLTFDRRNVTSISCLGRTVIEELSCISNTSYVHDTFTNYASNIRLNSILESPSFDAFEKVRANCWHVDRTWQCTASQREVDCSNDITKPWKYHIHWYDHNIRLWHEAYSGFFTRSASQFWLHTTKLWVRFDEREEQTWVGRSRIVGMICRKNQYIISFFLVCSTSAVLWYSRCSRPTGLDTFATSSGK